MFAIVSTSFHYISRTASVAASQSQPSHIQKLFTFWITLTLLQFFWLNLLINRNKEIVNCVEEHIHKKPFHLKCVLSLFCSFWAVVDFAECVWKRNWLNWMSTYRTLSKKFNQKLLDCCEGEGLERRQL